MTIQSLKQIVVTKKTKEHQTFREHVHQWIKDGLTGKFVAISGDQVLGFANEQNELPRNTAIFRIKLPTAGAWSDEKELMNYFYEQGTIRRPEP